MKYVNPNFTVNIDWNIQRGASRMREDFRRATLFVFLIGHDNVYPVTYTLEDNVIKAVIEPGLPEGVYGLRAIWFKDHHNPCEMRHAVHPFRNTVHCGKRSQSQIDNVFGITALMEESESLPENTLKVKLTSAVATYGYDGLSAYEIAIMSGETTLSQAEWVGNIVEANVKLDGIDERFESLETRTGNLFTNASFKNYETDIPGSDDYFWYDSTSLTTIPAGGIVRRVHSAPGNVMIIDADTNTFIAELSEANPSFTTEEQIRVYFGGDSSFADNSSGQVSIDLPASDLHDVLSDIYLNLREGEYREININTLQADALEDSVNINGKTYGNESFTITLPNANLDSAGVMSAYDKQTLQEHGNRIAQINTTLEEHTESINANITTERIEDGAVTSEKIATSAFDSTLSVSGKIAPADVVGEKLNELEKGINILEIESKETQLGSLSKAISETTHLYVNCSTSYIVGQIVSVIFRSSVDCVITPYAYGSGASIYRTYPNITLIANEDKMVKMSIDEVQGYYGFGGLATKAGTYKVNVSQTITESKAFANIYVKGKMFVTNGNVVYENDVIKSCNIVWADGKSGTLINSNWDDSVLEYATTKVTYDGTTYIYNRQYSELGEVIKETIN